MTFKYNDAGRLRAGFKSEKDCGIRALSIACEVEYIKAREVLKKAAKAGLQGNGQISRGIYKADMDSALASMGWAWKSAPTFEGRKARFSDLPQGRIIARMAKHYVAVIDGVLNDTWDSRGKMVYGYWEKSPLI